ncbi:MAG: ROK family protein, partial [Leeuwenhoekiella sp.]
MTLDAGGTNFVFSAMQGAQEIVQPIIRESNSAKLEECLKTIINGFKDLLKSLGTSKPAAISFAFPGPADYKSGIIGDLPNFPSFRGGVALGPMLEDIFNLPTFINNDGDLFTYGEAMGGFLPNLNALLQQKNINKTYTNLIGITLGTGFGGGIVVNNQLCQGDNSAAGEIWLTRNYKNSAYMAEEGVSIRAIQRAYSQQTKSSEVLAPKDIYDIALGKREGDKNAAEFAFEKTAEVIAESLAHALTLVDGPVVIGGGISGASKLILPKITEILNGTIKNQDGENIPRLVSKVYDLENSASEANFFNWNGNYINVPFNDRKILYNSEKRIPVGLSLLGT